MRVICSIVVLCAFACGRVGFSARPIDGGDAGSSSDSGSSPDGSTATTYYLVSSDGTNPSQFFTVDIATGKLALVGEIAASFGFVTGLAYWDTNKMYANTNTPNTILEITISPFSALVITGPAGDFAALERDGNRLLAVAQTTNRLVSFMPGDSVATSLPATLPVIGSGGDLTHTSDGRWFWFSNADKGLYALDLSSGAATLIGTSPGVPFMTGLVATDDDKLHVVGQQLYSVDKSTGQVGSATPVCYPCPTSYVLSSGDTTRTP